MARNSVDGRLAKLINTLRELIDEGTNVNEIVLKYKNLTRLARQGTVQQLIGRKHWGPLHKLLASPVARELLNHRRELASKGKTSKPVRS